jgi:hypothetical protein
MAYVHIFTPYHIKIVVVISSVCVIAVFSVVEQRCQRQAIAQSVYAANTKAIRDSGC